MGSSGIDSQPVRADASRALGISAHVVGQRVAGAAVSIPHPVFVSTRLSELGAAPDQLARSTEGTIRASVSSWRVGPGSGLWDVLARRPRPT